MTKLPYNTKISGTGSYLPEKKLTNKDIEQMVSTTEQWIYERTGISSRSIAKEGQSTSDLALIASQRAMEMAGITAQDIDMIIFGTVSPDQPMPSSACELQHKLGARTVMAFDLSAACSGFVYSLSIADQFIKTGVYKHILVVGAEILHYLVNYKDRNTCILFGDGAGAFITSRAEPGDDSVILSSHCHADGSIGDVFVLPAGGSVMPITHSVLEKGQHYVQMKGREIFKHAVRTMSECCTEALKANQMAPSEVSWVIPHQANIRIIEAVANHFGIPMDKVIVEIKDMGNTSAATIPVAMDRAIRDERIQRGQNILLTAFGAGVTSGSILLRF